MGQREKREENRGRRFGFSLVFWLGKEAERRLKKKEGISILKRKKERGEGSRARGEGLEELIFFFSLKGVFILASQAGHLKNRKRGEGVFFFGRAKRKKSEEGPRSFSAFFFLFSYV